MSEAEKTRELVEQIAAGNQVAMGEFYDLTIARAWAVVLRITHQHDIAEEVINDVYLQVWRQAGNYESERANPITWLMLICRSRAIDAIRKRRVPTSPFEDALDIVEDEVNQGPMELSESLHHGAMVREAIQTLNDDQRHMLDLAFFKGMSHQEISDYCQRPLGTVKSTLRRAQQLLRAALTEKGYDAAEVV